jgi:hypothetical protein
MIPGPNWARRYGSGTRHGRRQCARPGCQTPAAATLRFHPTQREATLVDFDASTPRAAGDLCARHAAAVVLPRGWSLHDHRTATLVVSEPAEVTPLRREPRPKVRVAPQLVPQELPPVPPQFGVAERQPDEELADVLDAHTPLLQRAFRNALPD